jgi:hypothetical protein
MANSSKQKAKIRRKGSKNADDISELAAMDFEPMPGKFDADAFNRTMEADKRHAYLALATLHQSKAELARAFVEIPEPMKSLAEASYETAQNLRALADTLETAHARMLCAAATLA